MKKALVTSAIAAAGIAVSSLSFAAAMPVHSMGPHGWYVGVGLNTTPFSAAHVTTGDNVNLRAGKYKLDKQRLGGNLFVGYRLTRHFGTELGGQAIGRIDYKGVGTNNNTGKIRERNTYHFYYDGYFYMPICDWFEVFAKGGVGFIHRSENVSGNAAVNGDYNNMFNAFALNYGAGVQFDIYQWAIRGAYTHIVPQDGSDLYVDIPDTINLDVLYHFG